MASEIRTNTCGSAMLSDYLVHRRRKRLESPTPTHSLPFQTPPKQLSSTRSLDSSIVCSQAEDVKSIIAVHGLNIWGNASHAENTWTHPETGVNWLRTLLPERLPNARVLAFQYNANVVFGTSTAGVTEQAVNLLGCMQIARKDDPTRPMIFIAHSMGGIIVKEALATAYREHKAYPMTWHFAYAIFFFAVPHKGSSLATLGQLLPNSGNSFLESLTETSAYSQELNLRFEPLFTAYKFYSWVETLRLPLVGRASLQIVAQDAAVLGLSAERETVRCPDRDHRTICKFSGEGDPEWKHLSSRIMEAANSATSTRDLTPTMHLRQAMFEVQPHQNSETLPESISEANRQAQQAINRVQSDRIELEKTQREVENARYKLINLACVLFAWVIPPFLKLFGIQVHVGPALPRLALQLTSWATPTLSLATSGRQRVLDGISEAVEIEDKVIKLETWAVEQLNVMHRDLLSTSSMLRTATIAHAVQGHDETRALQLDNARTLLDRISALMLTVTAEIYFRQQRADQAKAEKGRAQEYSTQLVNVPESEFWPIVGNIIEVEGVAQQEAAKHDNKDGGGWSWWPSSCVIL